MSSQPPPVPPPPADLTSPPTPPPPQTTRSPSSATTTTTPNQKPQQQQQKQEEEDDVDDDKFEKEPKFKHEHRHANGTPATFGRRKSNNSSNKKNDMYKTQIAVCLYGPDRRFNFRKPSATIKGWVERVPPGEGETKSKDSHETAQASTNDNNNDNTGTDNLTRQAPMESINETDDDDNSNNNTSTPSDDTNPTRHFARGADPTKSRLGPSNMDNPHLLRDIRSLTSSRRLNSVEPSLPVDVSLGQQARHIIDLQNVRRLASQGIPDAGSHRGVSWRVLLGYVPTDLSKWEEVLERDRTLYRNLVSELFVADKDKERAETPVEEEVKEGTRGNNDDNDNDDDDDDPHSPSLSPKQSLRVIEDWDNLKEKMEQRSNDECGRVQLEQNQMGRGEVEVNILSDDTTTNNTKSPKSNDDDNNEDVSYDVTPICSSTHHLPKNSPPPSPSPPTFNMSTSRPNFNTVTNTPDAHLPARIREHLKTTTSLTLHRSINELLIVDNAGNPPPPPTPPGTPQHQRKQQSYSSYDDHPLSNQHDDDDEQDDSKWKQYFENTKLLDEIRKDVVRTHPDLHFFLEPEDDLGQRRYAALERILFVWAKLNKGVRYVQGMNEIVGTIYFVLATDFNEEWACEAEADTYFLFNTLMVEMRDVFVPDLDEADTGIQGRISNFVTLLSLHDPEVRCHLDDIGIDASFYAIRWLTTLLSREFLLPDTIRLWDSMFASTHKDNFLRYVCVTMVMIIRDKLLASDFSTCLRLLQSYPPTNVDRLLESSRALWIYESQITLACHKGGISLQMALQTIAPPSAIIMAYGLAGGVAMDPARRLRASGEKILSEARKAVSEDYEGVKNAGKSLFGNIGNRGWWLGR